MMLTKWGIAIEFSAIKNFKCCYQGREIIPNINWLFRYMANCLCLLTPRMAYEYKWNCSANLQGGLGNNIPCDNLVELLVQTVKKAVYAQGANATFTSVRKAALAIQVQDEIKNNIQNECDKKQSGKKRPPVSKLVYISAMTSELVFIFDFVPGCEHPSFTGFKDVFLNIKVDELHNPNYEQRKTKL